MNARNPRNQVLQGCIDPFNPFEEGNSVYSMTPILLQYLTLPKSERYKNRNMDLIGVIPGPGNPYSFQPFIDVMVDELIELHNTGIEIEGVGNVRSMLLSFSCDYPGSRFSIYLLTNASFGQTRQYANCRRIWLPILLLKPETQI